MVPSHDDGDTSSGSCDHVTSCVAPDKDAILGLLWVSTSMPFILSVRTSMVNHIFISNNISSNPATLGTSQSVLITGVAYFQG